MVQRAEWWLHKQHYLVWWMLLQPWWARQHSQCVVWGAEKPNEPLTQEMFPQKVLVWLGVSSKCVIKPFFFDGTATIGGVHAAWCTTAYQSASEGILVDHIFSVQSHQSAFRHSLASTLTRLKSLWFLALGSLKRRGVSNTSNNSWWAQNENCGSHKLPYAGTGGTKHSTICLAA